MAETPRREFLKLALGGAFAAAGAALQRAAWAAPMAPPAPFSADSLLDMARELAKSPFKPPDATLPDAVRQAHRRAISGDPPQPQYGGLERREDRLCARTVAPRLCLRRAGADLRGRERPGTPTRLRPQRLRFRQAAAARRSARHRLLRRAAVARQRRPGLARTRDLPGRDVFSQPRSRPELGLNARGLSIRTGEAQGEEFPLFRAPVDREAEPGVRRPDNSRLARFGEPDRGV